MKALTLWQPWASAIAWGFKTIETRSWSTNHRGLLAIHAGKHFDKTAHYLICKSFPGLREIEDFPLGCIVATCQLESCDQIGRFTHHTLSEREKTLGDFTPGRWAWLLGAIQIIDPPIKARGRQGLWEWNEYVGK